MIVADRASPTAVPAPPEVRMSARPTSDPWLRRVQALLAKAESTEFPAEAETLLAKAQELMARHAIDDAMLQAAAGARRDDIITTVVTVETPYDGPKSTLLGRVASANQCRMVIQGGRRGARTCVVVGHRTDVEGTKTLYSALSLYATRAMLSATPPLGDAPRRFRHAFLLAFAWRIGERLREAARSAVHDAESERTTGPSVALVLHDRSDAVDRALAGQFPHLRTVRTSVSSVAGLASGRAAADTAALGHRPVAGPHDSLRAR
jgi:hypothetical protein